MKAPPHPGLAVKDELDELGLSIADAAEGLGVARQTLHRLVSGEAGISPEMAYRLERGIGSNADFWLRLQANYDLAEVRRHGDAIAVRKLVSRRLPVPPDAGPA